MEVVKLRRGPKPGYLEISDHTERLMMARPKPDMFTLIEENPFAETIEYGHYQRTNIVTEKGHAVFEWMGWKGEVVGR